MKKNVREMMEQIYKAFTMQVDAIGTLLDEGIATKEQYSNELYNAYNDFTTQIFRFGKYREFNYEDLEPYVSRGWDYYNEEESKRV